MPDRYIKQILEGDKEAFRFIIRDCKDGAYNLAFSIVKEEHTARDAVQRSFLKAYEGLSAFRYNSSFKTWFHRIVVNEAFQILRSRKPEHNLPIDGIAYDNIQTNQVQQKIYKEHLSYYINEVLASMKPNESLILKLYYLEEHSIKEICTITDWSLSNVKVILHRARKSMREILTETYNLKPEDLYL
ncbi:RNA polymerase sigma factor [soil metagenome]